MGSMKHAMEYLGLSIKEQNGDISVSMNDIMIVPLRFSALTTLLMFHGKTLNRSTPFP